MDEKIEKKRCLRCGYEWYPKKPDNQYPTGRIPHCPNCNNTLWDRPRKQAWAIKYAEFKKNKV